MKHKVKLEVSRKLNSVAFLIKECALKVYKTQDIALMQETALAAITHESLCELLEKDGHTEKIVGLINDFGRAVAQLYSNIINFKPNAKIETIINSDSHFDSLPKDKSLLN